MVRWRSLNNSLLPVKDILNDLTHDCSYRNNTGSSIKFWTSDIHNLNEFDRNNLIDRLDSDIEFIEFWLLRYNESLCDFLQTLKRSRSISTFKTSYQYKEIQTNVATLSKDVADLFHKQQEMLLYAKSFNMVF